MALKSARHEEEEEEEQSRRSRTYLFKYFCVFSAHTRVHIQPKRDGLQFVPYIFQLDLDVVMISTIIISK